MHLLDKRCCSWRRHRPELLAKRIWNTNRCTYRTRSVLGRTIRLSGRWGIWRKSSERKWELFTTAKSVVMSFRPRAFRSISWGQDNQRLHNGGNNWQQGKSHFGEAASIRGRLAARSANFVIDLTHPFLQAGFPGRWCQSALIIWSRFSKHRKRGHSRFCHRCTLINDYLVSLNMQN